MAGSHGGHLGFFPISREECMQKMKKEAEILLEAILRSRTKEAKMTQATKKRSVGRPRKPLILDPILSVQDYLNTDSENSGSKSSNVIVISVTSAGSKSSNSSLGNKRGRPKVYKNWFTFETWPHIQHSLSQCNYKLRDTISYLQRRWP